MITVPPLPETLRHQVAGLGGSDAQKGHANQYEKSQHDVARMAQKYIDE